MLSLHLIDRHFHAARHDALLDALSANGLELPLPLRVRLEQHPAAAIALGLRRLIELTYGPTTLSREMTAALLDNQRPDGSFDGDPLATAAASSALGKLLAEQATLSDPAASLARERALAALAGMQSDDGLFAALGSANGGAFGGGSGSVSGRTCGRASWDISAGAGTSGGGGGGDRTEQDRALTAAFILYLLARDDDFRAAVRYADLVGWFESHYDRLDEDVERFFHLAVQSPPSPDRKPSPALSAIAA